MNVIFFKKECRVKNIFKWILVGIFIMRTFQKESRTFEQVQSTPGLDGSPKTQTL